MKIIYEVPERLQSKFIDRSEAEIQALITNALEQSVDIKLIEAMMLDMLVEQEKQRSKLDSLAVTGIAVSQVQVDSNITKKEKVKKKERVQPKERTVTPVNTGNTAVDFFSTFTS